MEQKYIEIKGARVNNLKNVSVKIPRNKLVAIAGVSGSGKSSLAFDTLYAEGQRRYVESLSAYARQFLGRMKKPECDYIKGLPPAIAIEQKVIARNPRSTVGTTTEIYEFMRLLFARIGKTYSPISGKEVRKHTPEDLVECMKQYPEGTKFMLIAGNENVIDRLKVHHDRNATEIRLLDSGETAFADGNGRCTLRFFNDDGTTTDHHFSTIMEADGMTFEEPTEHMFAFNSPAGVCPTCEGFGSIIGIDENLVIPDKSLSVYDGCVACWRGEKLGEWKRYFVRRAEIDNFPIFTPYNELSEEHKGWLWHGLPCDVNADPHERVSIDEFFRMVRENQYKIQYRVMMARYRGKALCPDCHGTRLRKEAEYVKVGDKTITELVTMPVSDLAEWFNKLQLTDHERKTAKRLLTEITSRLQYLLDVGLGYITLNRPSNTLSGGESQRINLTTSIGSPLVGSLYILDEPSIGLHSRDTERLINILRKLRDLGNTVVVVEHDEDILRAADDLIEVGPDAGRLGGEIVKDGGYTSRYLDGTLSIPVPASRRPWNLSLTLHHCNLHNLKNIDVEIPLNVMTVITGVSGSGKSTLVKQILYPTMKGICDAAKGSGSASAPGIITGDYRLVRHVEMVDQNPIGKSTRSNAATYLKAYDAIRQLFASQALARQLGVTQAHFSFNTEGGRCEECKGAGTVTVEMQFMADLTLTCQACHGKRFKPDILEIRYKGKNIDDVLNMTVDEAIEFFEPDEKTTGKTGNASLLNQIIASLRPLADVGLGYIQLGQSSSTLSGGENQRVKLAYYIAQERQEPTLFIFDEPTTGLHFHDINLLLHAFDRLISRGHTILIVEHNLDVIKCADHVIDLGPEGGEAGGTIVATGTPEQVAATGKGYTSRYLKEKLS
ncbi:MAG: excinuclease ABC subunit UvrA [Prevotella sp.]|nr:excinuclease ABC subunit UvrA [Prevotella sp.]